MQFGHLFALATAFGIATPVIARRCVIVVVSRLDGREYESDWDRCDPPVAMHQFGRKSDLKIEKPGYVFWVQVDADCQTAVLVKGELPKNSRLSTRWED